MIEKNGWVKIHRKMLDWEWHGDPNVVALFVYILLTVNHEQGRWQGLEVNPGQVITSLPDLAKKVGLTIQQARTALLKLKSTGEITDKITNKFRLITVKKWNEYQSDNRQNNSQSTGKQQANQQASNRQHIGTRASERMQEDKNVRNKEGEGNGVQGEENRSLTLAPTPGDNAKNFFDTPERHEKAVAYYVSRGMSEEFARFNVQKFVSYWTEPSRSGKKMRWEMQEAFEITRRLATWMSKAESDSPPSVQSERSLQESLKKLSYAD